MSQDSAVNCGNCRFSIVSQDQNGKINFRQRVCKKNPPTPILITTPQGILQNNMWPSLAATDRCFSHEPLAAVIEAEEVEGKPN